jgi:hypothetical protein
VAADPIGMPQAGGVPTAPPAAALHVARGIAAGRLLIGGALVAAPSLARPWMGRKAADSAGGRVALRALGVRDLLLGGLTLHTLGHAQVAPRMLATCALADVVDGGATWAARRQLPAGATGVVALAASAAVGQVAVAAVLRRSL